LQEQEGRAGAEGRADSLAKLRKKLGELEGSMPDAKRRIEELSTTRAERRLQQMARLEAQWGKATLALDAARKELSTHARRVARLQRAIEVAKETQQTSAQARADALLAKERLRHQVVMRRLSGTAGDGESQ
jgi:chromosome segregation ATPase